MQIIASVVNPTDAPPRDAACWAGIGGGVGIWVKPDGGDVGIDGSIGGGIVGGIGGPTMLVPSIVPNIMKSEARFIM